MDEPKATTGTTSANEGPPDTAQAGPGDAGPGLLSPGPRFVDSYGLVLVMLIGSLFAGAIGGDHVYGRAAALCAVAVTTWLALRASDVHGWILRLAVALIPFATLVALVLAAFGSQTTAYVVIKVLTALLVVVAPVAIVRRLATHPVVSANTFYGAVSVYLLLGMFFATAYGIIGKVGGSPFFVQIDQASSVDYLYFSFITMATVGYGDLTAAGDIGRVVTVLEAITGQLYLITVVALVVQNIGAERQLRRRRD